MAKIAVKLDHPGIRQLLHGDPIAEATNQVAESIANAVRAELPDDAEVVVDSYTTDRRAASVTIRDARGRLWEVRDGVLARAAAALGLDVVRR